MMVKCICDIMKLKTTIILSLIVVLTLIPPVIADDSYRPYLHKANVPEHPKVSLYGSYSTDLFPGAATYTYPIEIPLGTNNLQPSISIAYNSQTIKQRPGILGAGWSLTQNYIYRDVNSTPDSTADDKFKLILNGVFYDLIYDSSDGFYHTKIESFIRVQNLTGANNLYGNYWIATTKDGTQYRFGYNTDSELTSNTGRSYALKWSLDQVTDTHDNKIFYSYLEDPNPEDNGAVYLSKIEYNNDKQRKIDLIYETSVRPDKRTVYEQGNIFSESRRLGSINITANGNLVRKYTFEYVDLNSEKSMSAISKIKYFGSDGTSVLHQISFDYHSTNTGFTKYTTQWIPPVSFSDDNNDFGVRTIDLNNDGFIDFIQGRQPTPENKTWINNRYNNWTLTTEWNTPVWITKNGTAFDLAYYCHASVCDTCQPGSCIYDKCFVSGCDCGQGRWYDKDQTMCQELEYRGYNGKTVDLDNGVKFADFNNDGFVDILQGNSNGTTKKAWANTGNGWVDVSNTWAPPVYFFESDIDVGVQLVDFNGDGRVDILQSKYDDGEVKGAYINNGNGWTNVSSTWVVPAYFMQNKEDGGVRIEDVNGDGLPDILESHTNGTETVKAWINTGSGWAESSVWQPPVLFTNVTKIDNGIRFVDVNGDGLTDILQALTNSSGTFKNTWINNGNGWTLNNSWESPEVFMSYGRNMGRRLADINGDGFVDILVAQTNSSGSFYWSWIKNYSTPFMLKNITNELGGVTSLNYQQSTQFNNNGTDTLSDIGFNVWVVGNVTNNNSLANSFNIIGTYAYNYSNGSYDYQDFEFRGFAQVNETKPDNSLVKHYFYQDDARKGKEYRTEVYNSSGKIYSKDEGLFNYTNTSAGYFKVLLLSQTSYLHDGVTDNPKVTNVSYSYDSYGNVVERILYGDMNVSGDEKYERYSYVYNTSAWIVDRLNRYQLFASNNDTKVRDFRYSYDGLTNSSVTKGDVTQAETWLDTGGNQKVNYEYDSYGNIIKETNPRSYETIYKYGLRDTTFTYPDRVTNALDHTTDYQYDLGTGNLLWQKQNDITNYFYYDVFGRIIKEVQPFDSSELPTKSYNYSFDGTAPELIKVSSRTSANKTFDTYYFYDGFANFVQLKRPSDSNQQIVKNFFYDGLGRVVSESNPYFATFSTSLTTPSTTVNSTNYTYDTLGRVNFIKNTDGTNKTINFDHRTITAYDENGHRKVYVLDGYDRITNVLEYNNEPVLKLNYETDTYNTSYQYDTADNLVKITDTLGNQFTFTYDSLGRRTALSDPDLGNWSYTYDLAGNLITQKQQGGGNLVTGDGYYREYDGLNQLIKIRNGSTSTSPQLENYTYDSFGQRIKIMRNDSAGTIIYIPFKELMQIRNSSGIYNYTYVYQDDVLVARVNPDGSKYYYHPDHLGSTSLITNSSGGVVENTFYSPYGEILGGGTIDVKLFTSQLRDPTTGQYMLGNSIPYSPEWGIRLKPDTTIQNIYNPQSLNRYSYAWNNPYKNKDPTGRVCVPCAFALYAIATYVYSVVTAPDFTTVDLPLLVVEGSKAIQGEPNDFGTQLAFTLLPYVPSPVSQVVKPVSKAVDKITDISRTIDKTSDIGRVGTKYLNPKEIRFAQKEVSSFIHTPKGGTRPLRDFISDLKTGKINPESVEPIRVVNKDGKLISLDNRRLYAYYETNLAEIPTIEVSLSDPKIAKEFVDKTGGVLEGFTFEEVVVRR